MYRSLQFAVLALSCGLTSCQFVADIESHKTDPLAQGCALPAPGANDAKIRLSNLVATSAPIDVCVRAAGASSYGRPVLRSSGRDKTNICGAGLAYPQVTIPFKAPVGSVDIKIIAAGQVCSATPIAEAKGVEVAPDIVRNVALMGGSDVAPSIQVIPEAPRPGSTNPDKALRFVNAVPGIALHFALSEKKDLPTTLREISLFTKAPLAFTEYPKKGDRGKANLAADDYGYIALPANPLSVGAAQRLDKALLALEVQGTGNLTLYAIGDPGSGSPVRGLLCRELEAVDGATADCRPTDLESFRIDVFNAGLYGAGASTEAARAPFTLQALAERGVDTDLLCVSEVSRHQGMDLPAAQKDWTQEKLIELARSVPGGFTDFHQGVTSLDTPLSDPVNQEGVVPEPTNRAACSAPVNPALVDAAYKCLSEKCADADGYTQGGTACYARECAPDLVALLYGNQEEKECYICLLVNGVSYKTWGKNREICTTDTRRQLAFDGQTTGMLLSKIPMIEKDQFVMNATVFRRTALYAKLQLEAEQTLDVYCVHSPALLGSQVAYIGEYNNNATGAATWQEEQTWAIQGLIKWIKQKSGNRPALILGDWSSSRKAYDKDGKQINDSFGLPVVADSNAKTIELMQQEFLEAYPELNAAMKPYVPECTRCPATRQEGRTNPYNVGVVDPIWQLRVYIKSPWLTNPTADAEIFYYDTAAVLINDPAFGVYGPYADTFGYRARIRRP